MVESDDVRYGVFLTPDAWTSAAVTAVTGFVRAQFGLVSAVAPTGAATCPSRATS